MKLKQGAFPGETSSRLDFQQDLPCVLLVLRKRPLILPMPGDSCQCIVAQKKRLSGVATGQPRRIDYRQAGNQAVTSTPDAEPVERQVFSEFMVYEWQTSLRNSLNLCNL